MVAVEKQALRGGQALPSESKAHHRLGAEFRRRVIGYIERCRLEDGGYFFARVPPSCSADTYFAVKSLALLGARPADPSAVIGFFLNQLKEGALGSITTVFHAVEAIRELGEIPDELKRHARQLVMAQQNSLGGFGAADNVYIEVASELEETYQAVSVLKAAGAEFDGEKVCSFVRRLLNRDGGYGKDGRSTLASTYYATAIYRVLGVEVPRTTATKAYLRRREARWEVQFIEDLYWLAGALASLSERLSHPEKAVEFVLGCRRRGGGFARAPVIGIPTLEYTFYALSILKEAGAL